VNPSDPFSALDNSFQIGRPMPAVAPSGRRPKRAVPEVDELFAAQKAMVKALNSLRSSQAQDDPDLQRAQERIEGGYRRLRNWLARHANEGMH
jgi:hypothetical protein